MVHVHSVPRRPRWRSSTSRDMHAAHDAWRGKATTPQLWHREPMSSGSAAVPAIRPSATATKSVCPGIDPRAGFERDRRRARHHVARHAAVGVELRHREEGPYPLAAVVAGLAQGELDFAGVAGEEDVVAPLAHVPGVDERAQLLEAADELAAGAVAVVSPLDRELDVVGDQLERRVRVGPVEGREVALEEAHAAALARPAASGGTPISARQRSVKNAATLLSVTIPFGRYQCQ